jgi:pimeloyl-ACP methyl ester carboxylesterase
MVGVEQYVGLSREEAYELAVKDMGEDGSKMLSNDDTGESNLSPADLLYLQDPENIKRFISDDATFAQGVTGYADDRLADCSAQGWSSFEVNNVSCPVNIIHGETDTIVPVAHALHTADIVKDSDLKVYPDHGHLSISDEINTNLQVLIARSKGK